VHGCTDESNDGCLEIRNAPGVVRGIKTPGIFSAVNLLSGSNTPALRRMHGEYLISTVGNYTSGAFEKSFNIVTMSSSQPIYASLGASTTS
jgi:hypothetical protein